MIRRQLAGPRPSAGASSGESYGGFCAAQLPVDATGWFARGVRHGGLPPLEATADDYHRADYPEVQRKSHKLFDRYPDDLSAVQLASSSACIGDEVTLPPAEAAAVRRFQQLGFMLGFDDGMEISTICSNRVLRRNPRRRAVLRVSPRTRELPTVRDQPDLRGAPRDVLHAARGVALVGARIRAEFPETEWAPGRPPSFTGEMIYPWMFDDYPGAAAAARSRAIGSPTATWPVLYDACAACAQRGPGAAVIYAEDMYVPRGHSEATAAAITA